MVDTNKLRGKIAENGLCMRDLSKLLGMSENSFYRKMKRGVFDSDEMYALIDILHIDNPIEIFFADNGA